MDQKFYILSIDGGGFRGAYTAHILKQMERTWGLDWHQRFDMFAGTSTGSILAAGLACGIPAEKLASFYASHGKAIFSRRRRSRLDVLGILTSKYSNKTLRRILLEELGSDTTLGDIPVPLILPAVDIGNGRVHVFKSKFADGFVRDPQVLVADAVLASCSAPTFFDPHIVDDLYQLVDGGLWANNPSLVAAIDAHYRLGIPFEQIRVLSLGTGNAKKAYPRFQARGWRDRFFWGWQGWGFATRWQGPKFIEFILNLQSESAHNMLSLMLGESPREPRQVLRLTFESDQPLPMDDTSRYDHWLEKADADFTHSSKQIRDFLQL